MYPPIEPYQTGKLKVSTIHTLQYGSIEENTTWDLVKDIEMLREELKVEKWHVFGGSWGSALALAYAQVLHRSLVISLYFHSSLTNFLGYLGTSQSREDPDHTGCFYVQKEVRSILDQVVYSQIADFALCSSERAFALQEIGASHIHPEAWDEYVSHIPESERHDTTRAYEPLLRSPDKEIRLKAAKAWATWEYTISKLYRDPASFDIGSDTEVLAKALIESHYFTNDCWLRDGQLLEKQEIDKIRHIPTIAVQGRYDIACPPTTAWELKKVWPEITLHIVPDAGHTSTEPGIAKLLVEATDKFADL
ncbi:hypothetical protein V5O48_012176 [Marasmius crinis-equi]|uniref:AB hydrolase-1 domain-containing protein n=1 Tax=Marasmius crinis-equi TaxID=585013 RepID=A0ABR3F402_9AGAR